MTGRGPGTGTDASPDHVRGIVERGDAGEWVAQMLGGRSEGPDGSNVDDAQENDSEQAVARVRSWYGPILVPAPQLLSGAPDGIGDAPDEPVDVAVAPEPVSYRTDATPPPVTPTIPPAIALYSRGRFTVIDGVDRIHRRVGDGHRDAWTLVGFEDPADRREFVDRAVERIERR